MKISLENFTREGVKMEKTNDGFLLSYSENGGRASLEFKKGTFCGFKFERSDFLVMDVTNLSDYSASIVWEFGQNGNPRCDTYLKMGLLPKVKTRLALPITAAEGEVLFLRRTPGKLKTVVLGRPVSLEDLTKFCITSEKAPKEVKFLISDFYISKQVPEFFVDDVKLVDELGQKKLSSWEGKTKSIDEMIEFMKREAQKEIGPQMEGRSPYGGDLSKRFEPTGFFALEHDGKRWYLKDPDGYAFISSGLDCVGVDGDCNLEGIESFCDYLPKKEGEFLSGAWRRWGDREPTMLSFHKLNLMRAFGEEWYEKWTHMTKRRLIEWGINTVACWSDPNFEKNSKIPYVHIFHGYPTTQKKIFRDFPDVFSEEFRQSAKDYAKQHEPYKDDKYLIGYFMSNEPNWAFVNNLNIAAVMLEKDEDFHSKDELVKFYKNKYKTIDKLNEAWKSGYETFEELKRPVKVKDRAKEALEDLWDFSKEMIREYSKVPALAIKEIDKNHLNLGLRYAWLSSDAIIAGSEYFDIFSFNCYDMDPYGSIEEIVKRVNKPVMIGEFHFGALDRGLDATGIRAVKNQKDRGKAYRRYMHRAVSHPFCVGAHYFTLNDQGYLGRFDGENYQIGFVDVCQKPYYDFIEGVKKANSEIYLVASGEMEVTNDIPEEIPRIFY